MKKSIAQIEQEVIQAANELQDNLFNFSEKMLAVLEELHSRERENGANRVASYASILRVYTHLHMGHVLGKMQELDNQEDRV